MRNVIRTAGVLAASLLVVTGCSASPPAARPAPTPPLKLDNVKLVAYTSCDDMLVGLRTAAAKNVSAWGLWGRPMPLDDMATAAKSAGGEAQEYSTTNVHEAGVDEPDLVKTDGKRIITVSQGVLRVVDIASKTVTGTLRLVPKEQSWAPADLLISGDRALVLFEGGGIIPFGAMAKVRPGLDGPHYMLVDLSGGLRVISTMSAKGAYVDARQVGSTVRVVVRSVPEITFPGGTNEKKALKANRAAVMAAPIDAWLPQYTIDGVTSRVGCEQVSHPETYTGTSMLSVFTFDLNGSGFNSAPAISLAADGDIVYGTQSSLYVATNPYWWNPSETDPETTQVHRFDVTGAGAPRYAGSGEVPGRMLNQYSLSEFDGRLRVATTGPKDSGVYVLDATTLSRLGQVTGLGRGERIYSVRFIGDAGYVVTFRQTDPLYTLNLRDPANPTVSGELELTGYSAYLHPASDGKLLGIGQEANKKGQAQGTQVSLFDVADPAHPRILSRYFRKDSGSEAEWDPHAFLYWPASGLAMVPLMNWQDDWAQGSKALVLHVTDSGITEVGTIKHPKVEQRDKFAPMDPSIKRCVIIGNTIWTVSDLGLKVSDQATLAEQAWIPFS